MAEFYNCGFLYCVNLKRAYVLECRGCKTLIVYVVAFGCFVFRFAQRVFVFTFNNLFLLFCRSLYCVPNFCIFFLYGEKWLKCLRFLL